jgi:predicted anti-sigma-YlaC factor YlaD
MFSRNLEGDITALDCQRMQQHIDACERCRKVCDSLKSVLAACEALPVPDVPDTLQEQIRKQLRARVEPLD